MARQRSTFNCHHVKPIKTGLLWFNVACGNHQRWLRCLTCGLAPQTRLSAYDGINLTTAPALCALINQLQMVTQIPWLYFTFLRTKRSLSEIKSFFIHLHQFKTYVLTQMPSLFLFTWCVLCQWEAPTSFTLQSLSSNLFAGLIITVMTRCVSIHWLCVRLCVCVFHYSRQSLSEKIKRRPHTQIIDWRQIIMTEFF